MAEAWDISDAFDDIWVKEHNQFVPSCITEIHDLDWSISADVITAVEEAEVAPASPSTAEAAAVPKVLALQSAEGYKGPDELSDYAADAACDGTFPTWTGEAATDLTELYDLDWAVMKTDVGNETTLNAPPTKVKSEELAVVAAKAVSDGTFPKQTGVGKEIELNMLPSQDKPEEPDQHATEEVCDDTFPTEEPAVEEDKAWGASVAQGVGGAATGRPKEPEEGADAAGKSRAFVETDGSTPMKPGAGEETTLNAMPAVDKPAVSAKHVVKYKVQEFKTLDLTPVDRALSPERLRRPMRQAKLTHTSVSPCSGHGIEHRMEDPQGKATADSLSLAGLSGGGMGRLDGMGGGGMDGLGGVGAIGGMDGQGRKGDMGGEDRKEGLGGMDRVGSMGAWDGLGGGCGMDSDKVQPGPWAERYVFPNYELVDTAGSKPAAGSVRSETKVARQAGGSASSGRGRIGRTVARDAMEDPKTDLKRVNTSCDGDHPAYPMKHDYIHGHNGTFEVGGDSPVVEGQKIAQSHTHAAALSSRQQDKDPNGHHFSDGDKQHMLPGQPCCLARLRALGVSISDVRSGRAKLYRDRVGRVSIEIDDNIGRVSDSESDGCSDELWPEYMHDDGTSAQESSDEFDYDTDSLVPECHGFDGYSAGWSPAEQAAGSAILRQIAEARRHRAELRARLDAAARNGDTSSHYAPGVWTTGPTQETEPAKEATKPPEQAKPAVPAPAPADGADGIGGPLGDGWGGYHMHGYGETDMEGCGGKHGHGLGGMGTEGMGGIGDGAFDAPMQRQEQLPSIIKGQDDTPSVTDLPAVEGLDTSRKKRNQRSRPRGKRAGAGKR